MNNSNFIVFLNIPVSRYSVDYYVLWLIHIALFGLFIIFFIKELVMRYRIKKASTKPGDFCDPTVIRGEKSMNGLFIMYGTATVIYSMAIQVADCWKDYKAFSIVFDYTVLTYLFLFNSRFRNSFVFKIFNRIQKD